MTRRTILAAALAATACMAAAPAAAEADSLVYIKDHDVWIANPDGSGQYRVTTDGAADWAYGSPTQADDGTIVARRGTDIVRMRQNGKVLSQFDPPDTTDSAGQVIGGTPADVAVSPDGSKIAYTYVHANCPPGVSCGTRYVTITTPSDRHVTLGKNSRRSPSWASNDRLLLFNGFLHQVNYDAAPGGGQHDDVHWFDDYEMFDPSTDLGDGELSRAGDRFVALRGYGPTTHLMFYKVTENALSGTPSNPPAYACNTGHEETLDSPSWSPDGKAVAFAHKDGIEVLPLPSVDPDCPGAQSGKVVLPGGSEPDWGPAAVNPGPRDVTPGQCGAGCPKKRPKGSRRKGGMKIARPAGVDVAQALRKGLPLRVTVPGAGTVKATATVGGKAVGAGRATAKRAGTVTVRVRIARKKAFRRAARVGLRARFSPKGGGAAKIARTTLRLKVAAPAAASAAVGGGMRRAKFVAYVEGKQVTRWKIPRYGTHSNCQGQYTKEGEGSETVRFRTKPARLLVYGSARGGVQVKVGTWSIFQPGKGYGLKGTGSIRRTGKIVHGLETGQCHDAGDPTSWDTGPYDCGTRKFDTTVTLGWRANRVRVGIVGEDFIPLPSPGVGGYRNCPIDAPDDVVKGHFTDIDQAYPTSDLFDASQGLVVVLGRKSWRSKIERDHGTATTTTTFTIRMRRAR